MEEETWWGGGMARARWLAPWRESGKKPVIYHVVSRVVERRSAFGPVEKEKFRTLMKMTESFTGCRVLSYVIMSNHFHLLLEVPPRSALQLDDQEFFRRLQVFYPEWKIQEQEKLLAEARKKGDKQEEQRIFESYSYRMHDLSEFMKTLLQRFTSWFNRTHERTGRLWEQRFKSILVEGGTAAAAISAYIDLNPVRAGICEDPIDYRWCSYAEALAGGRKAQAGLARVYRYLAGTVAPPDRIRSEIRAWSQEGLDKKYRILLLGKAHEVINHDGTIRRKGVAPKKVKAEKERLETSDDRAVAISRVVRHRIRYFTDGAAIGSRAYVDEVFRGSREYFGANRQTGARKPRGSLGKLAGVIWTARNLRVKV